MLIETLMFSGTKFIEIIEPEKEKKNPPLLTFDPPLSLCTWMGAHRDTQSFFSHTQSFFFSISCFPLSPTLSLHFERKEFSRIALFSLSLSTVERELFSHSAKAKGPPSPKVLIFEALLGFLFYLYFSTGFSDLPKWGLSFSLLVALYIDF